MGKTESPIQVFGLGQCSLDYIGKVDAYPPPDVKCAFSDLVIPSPQQLMEQGY